MDEPNEMLTEESKANLGFAAKIATVLSFGCVMGAVYTGFVAWRQLFHLNSGFAEWSWIHYIAVIRTLFPPALLVFAWVAWQAASTMHAIGTAESGGKLVDWNRHASNTAWLWIALALIAVVALLEMAVRYSGRYFVGI